MAEWPKAPSCYLGGDASRPRVRIALDPLMVVDFDVHEYQAALVILLSSLSKDKRRLRTTVLGRVVERVKTAVLKTAEPKGSVGSNPTSSSKVFQ